MKVTWSFSFCTKFLAKNGFAKKTIPFMREKENEWRILRKIYFLTNSVFVWRGGECMAGKLERDFQKDLVKELKDRFVGAIVTKLDSSHIQGIPDLLILFGDKWATLECKKCSGASHRPNQNYYVDRMNQMGFSKFIFPENKGDVLNELEIYFQQSRKS